MGAPGPSPLPPPPFSCVARTRQLLRECYRGLVFERSDSRRESTHFDPALLHCVHWLTIQRSNGPRLRGTRRAGVLKSRPVAIAATPSESRIAFRTPTPTVSI